MDIIALYNLKGGVGKTTSCVNLAYAAAKDGFKTLVWDLDAQGAASFFLKEQDQQSVAIASVINDNATIEDAIQATPYQNLDIIPADKSIRHLDILLDVHNDSPKKQLKKVLKPLKKDYDFIFLDCAPGFSSVAEGIFRMADVILMPIIPTTLSVRTFEIVRDYMLQQKIDDSKLMCFFNMVDVRKNLHLEVMQQIGSLNRFFQYYIPNASEIEKMGVKVKPLLYSNPASRGAQSFKALWEEIKEGILA